MPVTLRSAGEARGSRDQNIGAGGYRAGRGLWRNATVYFEIDGTNPGSPWTAGPGSFVDMMISLAGGDNIVDASSAFVQLSLEELIAADPDLIILGNYPFVTPEQVMQRGGVWQELSAVESRRVYFINDTALTSRPGPRIIDGLEEVARIIHPELFSQPVTGSQ